MKQWILALALVGSTLSLPACQRPVTITTDAGKLAFTADQIVLRVNELQRAAIDANTRGILDIGTTRTLERDGHRLMARGEDGDPHDQ